MLVGPGLKRALLVLALTGFYLLLLLLPEWPQRSGTWLPRRGGEAEAPMDPGMAEYLRAHGGLAEESFDPHHPLPAPEARDQGR